MVLRVFITGFGKFANVTQNPTTFIVDDILARPDFYFNDTNTPNCKLQQANILVVSTQAVHDYFQSLAKSQFFTADNDPILFLHFGVFAAAKCYQIEQRAYNDASFRAPDECAFQPVKIPISTILQGNPWLDENDTAIAHDTSYFCNSSLNVDALVSITNATCEALGHIPLATLLAKKQVSTYNVENKQDDVSLNNLPANKYCIPSTDAGRYLCNYIYFTSFLFGKSKSSSNKPIYSLFVHVPSQDTVPMPEQFKFVQALLHGISVLFQN